MVKEITNDQMKATTEAAKALENAARKGMGTPIELRIAEALLENASNLDKQSKATVQMMEQLEIAVGEASKAAATANASSESAARACNEVQQISARAVKGVWAGAREAVAESMPAECSQLITSAQSDIAFASRQAKEQITEAANNASRSIAKAQEAADDWKSRSSKNDWFHSLRKGARAVVVIAMFCCIALTGWAGWRCLPIVTGKAQITYTASYQSELDVMKKQLQVTTNELNAYKDAYPEGLSEQRLHDLNELNKK